MFSYRIKFRNPFVLARVSYFVDVAVRCAVFGDDEYCREFSRLDEAKYFAKEMVTAYSGTGADSLIYVSRHIDGVFDERLFESGCGLKPVFFVNRKVK